MTTYFCGLLGMDGCIQRFGDMAAAFCFSVVCLSYLVLFGGRVAGICSAYISPLVGSVVGFVLLIFHVWFWTFLLV